MQRAYDSKVVALAVGHSFKWIDNLLSQNQLPGVRRERQGVARAITDDGLLAVEITRLLVSHVGIPIARAAAIAARVVASGERPLTRLTLDGGLAIEIEVEAIELRLR